MMPPDWIAVDWGTSRMRAWAMSESGAVLDRVDCEMGMRYLQSAEYESVLLGRIEPWVPQAGRISVIACGMLGSKQGWAEALYLRAPCSPIGEFTIASSRDDRLDVRICPGIKQAQPADVMRGEEIQIAGLLASRANFDGVACLPGTHSKWVRISGGKIRSFQTVLTGELFALLAEQSVLQYSVAADGLDQQAFLQSVEEMMSDPGMLSSRLFSIRAESLLADEFPVTSRSRLSGYLIGAELAATRPYWQDRPNLALVGSGGLCDLYASAFAAQGIDFEMYPGEELTLAGLFLAYKGTRHD